MEEKNPKMNKELEKWIKESKGKSSLNKDGENKEKKAKGKCQVCGKKKATAICLKCDRPVCTSCYFKLIGVCKKCVHSNVAKKWDGSHPDWEKELGVDWVD